jgi:hypothetical protein
MPRVPVPGRGQEYVRVIKTEEKGSDVNLATHLLHDAHMGRFELGVVVSNDSDLLEPNQDHVCDQLHKEGRHSEPAEKAKPRAAAAYRLNQTNPCRCPSGFAIPATMTDQHGTFTRPATW